MITPAPKTTAPVTTAPVAPAAKVAPVAPAAPPAPPADPHKNATKLDEVDALKLENFALKVTNSQQALTQLQQAQQAHVNDIITRYTGDNETISLGPDGRTIVRTKKASA